MTGVAVLLALATRGAAAERWLPDPGAPISFSARNIASFGLAVRTSARDPNLIGKASLDPGLCAADDCIGVRADDTGPNERYLAAPGALSSNTDDGDVNFAKGDFTNVVAKWTTSWTIDWDQYRFNLGAILFFDPLNTGFEELRLNQKVSPGPGPGQRVRVRRTRETERDIGYDFELREANAQRSAHLFGLPVDLLIGRHRLPLGESALSVRGTLDFMNPPDVNNLTRPGFKLVELYKPVGMVLAHTHLGLDLRAEGWWQFEWRPLGLPAKGSFFSFFDAGNEVTSDDHVVAPLAKAPDDPRQIQTPANPFLASITATSFNLRRAANREPGALTQLGQLGVALYWKRPDLLDKGVEFGFLLASYHARIPAVSAYASEASCTRREGNGRHQDAANVADFSLDCGVPGISRPGVDFEALPVDTTRYVLDYPENVVLLGTSAHAEIGGNYWQAEVAFRPNDPVQVDMEDLFFAAMQPAFPRHTIDFGVGTLASSRRAIPDFVTAYRGGVPGEVVPGQYIRGYERLQTIQTGLGFTSIRGERAWLRASDSALIGELQMVWVPGLPPQRQLQLEGPGTNTHASPGIAETGDALRINPIQNRSGYVTPFAWGYRLGLLLNYREMWIRGLEVRPLLVFTHDVGGVGPGLAENFLRQRKIAVVNSQFAYERWSLDLAHSWIFGGGDRNTLHDRTFFSASLSREF